MKPMMCENHPQEQATELVSITGEPADRVYAGVAERKRGPLLRNVCATCAAELRAKAKEQSERE